MGAKPHTRQRTAKWSVASLTLLVSLHCNVYDASLLGMGESAVGGTATAGAAGASTAIGGSSAASGGLAGDSEVESGAPGAGFGGMSDMAGALETGGDGARAGSAGNAAGSAGAGGAVVGSAGGAVAGGAGGTIGGTGGATGAGGAMAGAGGSSQTANGCAKLFVPFDDAADKAHFVISLTSPADLSGATISMRLYVQAGVGGSIFNYVQDSGTYHFLGVPAAKRRLLSSTSGWSTAQLECRHRTGCGQRHRQNQYQEHWHRAQRSAVFHLVQSDDRLCRFGHRDEPLSFLHLRRNWLGVSHSDDDECPARSTLVEQRRLGHDCQRSERSAGNRLAPESPVSRQPGERATARNRTRLVAMANLATEIVERSYCVGMRSPLPTLVGEIRS